MGIEKSLSIRVSTCDDTSVTYSWFEVNVYISITTFVMSRKRVMGIEKTKKISDPFDSLGHVLSVGGFFLKSSGWYRKKEDLVAEEDEVVKGMVSSSVDGPISFSTNGVRRGLAMAGLKWFFDLFLKAIVIFPSHFFILNDCATRIFHIFNWGNRG